MNRNFTLILVISFLVQIKLSSREILKILIINYNITQLYSFFNFMKIFLKRNQR